MSAIVDFELWTGESTDIEAVLTYVDIEVSEAVCYPVDYDSTSVLAADVNNASSGWTMADDAADATCEEVEEMACSSVGSLADEESPILVICVAWWCGTRSGTNSSMVPSVVSATGCPEEASD